MPRNMQYVCDKCGVTVLQEGDSIHQDLPDGWCLLLGSYFCRDCFSNLRSIVSPAADKVQEYLGSFLNQCKDETAKRRVSAALTRDVAAEIWKMIPRPSPDKE